MTPDMFDDTPARPLGVPRCVSRTMRKNAALEERKIWNVLRRGIVSQLAMWLCLDMSHVKESKEVQSKVSRKFGIEKGWQVVQFPESTLL